jgi:RNA polymerase sporulation-specific sigma factor
VFFLCGYITNPQSFPTPLTAEEEKNLVIRYSGGDATAKNILIERNLRLVAHIAKKYSSSNDIDDLISIGAIGLIKAITTFDHTKGIRLATYASKCIDNEILMYIRSRKKLVNEVSINEPIGVDREGNTITYDDIIGSDTDSVVDEVDLKEKIKLLYANMKKVLKKREKEILELRYGLANGNIMTQREIADMMNISRSYVSRIEKKAIDKLEKELR